MAQTGSCWIPAGTPRISSGRTRKRSPCGRDRRVRNQGFTHSGISPGKSFPSGSSKCPAMDTTLICRVRTRTGFSTTLIQIEKLRVRRFTCFTFRVVSVLISGISPRPRLIEESGDAILIPAVVKMEPGLQLTVHMMVAGRFTCWISVLSSIQSEICRVVFRGVVETAPRTCRLMQ